MSNYNSLKTTIDANIKQNGRQEITGQILNSVLNQMVTTLGTGYQFMGVATIDTNPGSPDAKVFYIANGKGTYEKFGGLEVTEDEVVILYWDSSWHKESTGIASNEKVSELESELYVTSINLYDASKQTEDTISPHYYVDGYPYSSTEYDGQYNATALIEIQPNTQYSIGLVPKFGNAQKPWWAASYGLFFYDSEKTYIIGTTEETFLTPSN